MIQLTEYVTGLNARIGYPNEHLAGGHIDELTKPMYSTCIGLILKGYNDFENKNRPLDESFRKITVPTSLRRPVATETMSKAIDGVEYEQLSNDKKVNDRKSLKGFMDSFKIGLIDLFKEEEDGKL